METGSRTAHVNNTVEKQGEILTTMQNKDFSLSRTTAVCFSTYSRPMVLHLIYKFMLTNAHYTVLDIYFTLFILKQLQYIFLYY